MSQPDRRLSRRKPVVPAATVKECKTEDHQRPFRSSIDRPNSLYVSLRTKETTRSFQDHSSSGSTYSLHRSPSGDSSKVSEQRKPTAVRQAKLHPFHSLEHRSQNQIRQIHRDKFKSHPAIFTIILILVLYFGVRWVDLTAYNDDAVRSLKDYARMDLSEIKQRSLHDIVYDLLEGTSKFQDACREAHKSTEYGVSIQIGKTAAQGDHKRAKKANIKDEEAIVEQLEGFISTIEPLSSQTKHFRNEAENLCNYSQRSLATTLSILKDLKKYTAAGSKLPSRFPDPLHIVHLSTPSLAGGSPEKYHQNTLDKTQKLIETGSQLKADVARLLDQRDALKILQAKEAQLSHVEGNYIEAILDRVSNSTAYFISAGNHLIAMGREYDVEAWQKLDSNALEQLVGRIQAAHKTRK